MSNALILFLIIFCIAALIALLFFAPKAVRTAVGKVKGEPKTGKKSKPSVFEIVIYPIIMLYCILMIYMIVWAFICSLKSGDGWAFEHLGLETDWQFSNYAVAFSKIRVTSGNVQANIFECLINGFVYSAGAAFFQLMATVMVAYCTARFNCTLSRIIHSVVIVVLVLPIAGNLASQVEIAQMFHAYDSMIGMFVMKFGYSNIYYLIFYATFKALPKDYMESAYMDGANHLVIFLKIMLPLVSTLCGAIFLLYFINYWNDYQFPMIFMPSLPTASYALYLFIDPNGSGGSIEVAQNSALRITAGFLVFIPIFIIFMLFKDKIMGNLQTGGIKE